MSHRKRTLGGLNIHRPRGAGKLGRVRKPGPVTDLDVEDALRARYLTADLVAPRRPQIVADAEYRRMLGLATELAAGRISVRDFRAQLRGEA